MSKQDELSLGLSRVLSLGGVSEELNMTEDQRYALDDLWLITEINLKSEIQKFQSEYSEVLPDVAIENLKSAFKDAVQKIRDNEIERIEKVLSDEQIDRLKQIRFQYLSKSGSGIQGIAEDIELTSEQVEQIKGLQQTLKQEVAVLKTENRTAKMPQADLVHGVKNLMRDFEDEVAAVLTPAQQRKLESLKGDTFEFQYGPRPKNEDEEADAGN